MAFKKRKRLKSLEFLILFYGLIFLSECAQFLFGETESWSSRSYLHQFGNQSMQGLYSVDQSQLYNFRYMLEVCRDLDDVMAAITVSPCLPETDFLYQFAHHAKLPALSLQEYCELNSTDNTASDVIKKNRSPLSVAWSVGWADPSTVLARAVTHEAWKEVIIIVDNHTDHHPILDRLLIHLGDLSVLSSLFTVDTVEDITEIVTNLSRWKSPQWAVPHILLCDMNNTKQILTQAAEVGMSRLEYFWMVYNSGKPEDLYKILKPSDNVAFVRLNTEALETYTRVLQQSVSDVMGVTEQVVRQYEALTGDSRQTSRNSMCTTSLKEDLVMQIHHTLNSSSYLEVNYTNLDPLYTIQSSVTRDIRQPEMELVATWSPDNTLEVFDSLFPNSFFHGFNKRVFHVASIEYSFFQQKVVHENGTVHWRGLTFQLLDELGKDLNFTYVVHESVDLQWGIEDENGNWTGMIGMVMSKSVDFAAACFSITAAREEVVDFPSPYYHDQSVVVLKRPGQQNRMLLYVYPFHWKVWAGTLGSIFLCGPVLWILTRASPYYDKHGNPWGDYQGLFRLDNAVLYIFGAFFQQGGIWLPDSQSGRVLVGCFWFFVIAVVAIYTGNLIAFLAVSTLEMPFDTLTGLVSQSNLQFGPSEGVALVMLFRDATFEPYTSVYQKMVTVPTYAEGLRRVKEGDYAFISEKSWYHSVSAVDAECEIAMMKEEFYPTSYGWALQPGSPYLEHFSDKINKIRESGLLHKWIQDWTPNNTHCKGLGPMTQTKVATVTDFQGALFLLGIGLAIGIFLLMLEIGYFNMWTTFWRKRKFPLNQKHMNGNGVGCNGHTLNSSSSSRDDLIHSPYLESMFHIQV